MTASATDVRRSLRELAHTRFHALQLSREQRRALTAEDAFVKGYMHGMQVARAMVLRLDKQAAHAYLIGLRHGRQAASLKEAS
jgi:soluble cytochrome b562